jgi:hypothetical protein
VDRRDGGNPDLAGGAGGGGGGGRSAHVAPKPPKPKPHAAAPPPRGAWPPPAQDANRYATLSPADAAGGADGAAPAAGAQPPAKLQSKAARKVARLEGERATAAEFLAALEEASARAQCAELVRMQQEHNDAQRRKSHVAK